MRGLRRRVAGGSHVSDNVPALHGHPFGQTGGITVQMGVIVAKYAWAVELVNRDAPGLAQEELLDDAIFYRHDRCSTGRQNIGSLMQRPSGPPLRKSVSDIMSIHAMNRESQLAPGEQLIVVACPKIIGGNRTRECVQKDYESADREWKTRSNESTP